MFFEHNKKIHIHNLPQSNLLSVWIKTLTVHTVDNNAVHKAVLRLLIGISQLTSIEILLSVWIKAFARGAVASDKNVKTSCVRAVTTPIY